MKESEMISTLREHWPIAADRMAELEGSNKELAKTISLLQAEIRGLREALQAPVVVAFPTNEGGRSKRVDEWLADWREHCDFHEDIVYGAIIEWIRGVLLIEALSGRD